MKLFMSLFLILSLATFVGCGEEEQEAEQPSSSGSGDSGSGGSGSGSGVTVVEDSEGYLFLSASTYNGGFNYTGTSGGNLATTTDTICATDAATLSLSGEFKAVVATAARSISSNWTLKNSATYYRPDGTLIGTTDSSGAFNFPLSNSISASAAEYWSGVATDMTRETFSHCSEYTDGFAPAQGAVGNATATTTDAVRSGLGFL